MRRSFAVTSVARTLLDMSPGQSADTVGGWVHEAMVQRVVRLRDINSVLTREPCHGGRKVLEAALLVEVAPTRTGLEDLMLAAWRRAGLPAARVNQRIWTGEKLEEVDLHSPELRLVAEVDGGRYHSSRWRRRRDAEKDARMRAAGWKVLRVPELQLTFEAASVRADLRALAGLG